MTTIIQDILNGQYDDQIDTLSDALHSRRKIVRQTSIAQTMLTVGVGDTVKFSNIRPKYMVGAIGEVVDKKRTKLGVKLISGNIPHNGRFRIGETLSVPASCVEKVS